MGRCGYLLPVTKIRVLLIGGTVALALLLGACGDDDEGASSDGSQPAGGGAEVFSQNCASCHGQDGEGGIGPQLGDGAVAEAYPDVEDQIAVITNGRGNMPSFDGQLTEDQIRSVAMFEREELGQ
jgi:mono/diheme cytochrome c family protein